MQGVPGGMCQTAAEGQLYNPKQLCPKLNGYLDNGMRSVILRFHVLYLFSGCVVRALRMRSQQCKMSTSMHVPCKVLGTLSTTTV